MQEILEFARQNAFMSGLWVVLLVALIVTWIRSKSSPVKDMSTHQATVWVNKENGVFVDIRNQDDFRKAHIHGAKSLPLTQIKQKNVSAIEKYKDAPIVVVCNSGATARGAAMQLTQQGFANVAVLAGGMNAWRNEKLPVASGK
ncbi:MAG: rhodanese-like domain-containing protein [Idiomarina sp.]|mgnify:FL=1|jgi:rhodanese-related sulfurtransferase|uniref:rhodanese-like domain-containing protein n=1 Tax=Idiomarina sp. TaxID=1874361 RepID=UPI000C109502|nr:rhodanese-like domain-containing protein [Idiomarina sp.]MAK72471.1 rhodanese-like domain-containing protein [Idiomarinaceae bacterium]MBL4741370.1 rhodanese-like domain-containing protein [Idiomarina sp.]MBT41533.1 rhodanese-like domain-containing protein [Idiomarina sp.]PHQ77992.1 MAG: rhodanese-like domain-containing protein [Idiomarina sp.]HAD48045.1 rhodanese-like domain-containing protein [Idiomarina sp.]